jgi:hypothetical protein
MTFRYNTPNRWDENDRLGPISDPAPVFDVAFSDFSFTEINLP